MIKVKCKMCGLRGYFDESKITEFWASRFLHFHINKSEDYFSSKNSNYICRKCLTSILDSLKFESYRIEDLYKPQIEEKFDKGKNKK